MNSAWSKLIMLLSMCVPALCRNEGEDRLAQFLNHSIQIPGWFVLLAVLVSSGYYLLAKRSKASKQAAGPENSTSLLKKVDHVTYACEKGSIERWAWFHIEVEGGTLINRIDDVRPGDPDSSMKIWCIEHRSFGIALVEGIDRAKLSQVTKFVKKHGDHACQHVAYDTDDLDAFRERLGCYGGSLRGSTLVRNDGFGILKQMFARGYSRGNAAEASFPEYVERPKAGEDAKTVAITFSKTAGKGFYDQIEQAQDVGDEEPFFNWSKMPKDWKVPEPQPKGC